MMSSTRESGGDIKTETDRRGTEGQRVRLFNTNALATYSTNSDKMSNLIQHHVRKIACYFSSSNFK